MRFPQEYNRRSVQVFYFVLFCMTKILIALIGTLLCLSGSAQINLQNYDTILIRKPTEHKMSYEFSNRFFRVVSINRSKMVAEGNYASVSGELNGPNSLMGIVGKGPVPNQLYPSVLATDPAGLDWSVDLYSKGTTLNNLLKTAEGKPAVVPEAYLSFWDRGNLGLIRHYEDTIAAFGVTWQPAKDSLFKKVYLETRGLHPPIDPKRKKSDEGVGLVYKNYGVYGDFKGAELMIIFYEKNRTAYIYLNGHLDAIYQIDFDQPGIRVIKIFKGNPRVPPVLLARKGLTEEQQADLSRLAVFCMLMAQLTR